VTSVTEGTVRRLVRDDDPDAYHADNHQAVCQECGWQGQIANFNWGPKGARREGLQHDFDTGHTTITESWCDCFDDPADREGVA
jgi:hypothetical protein